MHIETELVVRMSYVWTSTHRGFFSAIWVAQQLKRLTGDQKVAGFIYRLGLRNFPSFQESLSSKQK